MNGNKQHYGRLVALMAVASLAFMALGGVVSAESINISDGSVSTYVEIDNETYRYNATSTPRYSDDLTDRWSFDSTPPENELDGPNGALDNASDVSLVDGVGDDAYKFAGKALLNVTSGVELGSEGWTTSMWVDWPTASTDGAVLLAQGSQGIDGSLEILVPSDATTDGDGDVDDLALRLRGIEGSSTKIIATNVSAFQNGAALTHLAVTYNGSDAVIYANGTEIANASADFASDGDDLIVGGYPSIVPNYNRTVDEVRIYDDALTDSSIEELHSEAGEPAKIDYYFPDGGFTSPSFNISRASRIAVNVSELTGASLDLYVERNASGDWLVDNQTKGIAEEGWVNMTADGYFSQERRVRGNWSADEDASGVIDRIIGGGGSSGGALFVIPVLLIGVSAEMAGFGVVLLAFVAILAVWRWRD